MKCAKSSVTVAAHRAWIPAFLQEPLRIESRTLQFGCQEVKEGLAFVGLGPGQGVLHFRLSGSRPTPGGRFEDVVGYTVEVNLLATKDVRGHQLHFDLAPDSTTGPTLSSASPS